MKFNLSHKKIQTTSTYFNPLPTPIYLRKEQAIRAKMTYDKLLEDHVLKKAGFVVEGI